MVKIEDVERFIEYIKRPRDLTGPHFSREENERIKQYQSLAPLFFQDLKNDGFLKFEDLYPSNNTKLVEIERQGDNFVRFTKLASGISNKLFGNFSADEQYFILGLIYMFWCEEIRALFVDFIHDINKTLLHPVDLKRFPTLGPLISVLSQYKDGKYQDLFSDIDCDLRNSFAHFTFSFDDEKNEIVYYDNSRNEKRINAKDFIRLIRLTSALFTVLYAEQTKVFAPEYQSFVNRVREKSFS
jgi:hypothetical protein